MATASVSCKEVNFTMNSHHNYAMLKSTWQLVLGDTKLIVRSLDLKFSKPIQVGAFFFKN